MPFPCIGGVPEKQDIQRFPLFIWRLGKIPGLQLVAQVLGQGGQVVEGYGFRHGLLLLRRW